MHATLRPADTQRAATPAAPAAHDWLLLGLIVAIALVEAT
jgi:hypothetical protein